MVADNENNGSKGSFSPHEEVGVLLKKAREKAGITTETVAKDLKLRAEYIDLIEQGMFSAVHKKIYYYGYISLISRYLGIDHLKVTRHVFDSDFGFQKNVKKTNDNRNGNYRSVGNKNSCKSTVSCQRSNIIFLIIAIIAFSLLTVFSYYKKHTKPSSVISSVSSRK